MPLRTSPMKPILLLYILSCCLCAAESVTTLEEHKTFFADRLKLEANAVAADQLSMRYSRYEASTKEELVKGEFETTAQFKQRQADRLASLDQERNDLHAAATKGIADGEELQTRIQKRERALSDLNITVKVKMGPYDADKQIVTSFTPETHILGTYSERAAAVVPSVTMPRFACAVDVARRLREASDKGELYCTITLTDPKLRLVQGPLTLPATTGDKWGEALGKIGLAIIVNAIDPSKVDQVPTNISDSKTRQANSIEINGCSTIKYLNFLNKSGAILAK